MGEEHAIDGRVHVSFERFILALRSCASAAGGEVVEKGSDAVELIRRALCGGAQALPLPLLLALLLAESSEQPRSGGAELRAA